MRERGAEPVSFNQLLRSADIVSLHCPRDASTLGIMNAEAFAAMRPGSIFISTARGGIHDEMALYRALSSGHLAGAGLDVWDEEPPLPVILSSPLGTSWPHFTPQALRMMPDAGTPHWPLPRLWSCWQPVRGRSAW